MLYCIWREVVYCIWLTNHVTDASFQMSQSGGWIGLSVHIYVFVCVCVCVFVCACLSVHTCHVTYDTCSEWTELSAEDGVLCTG